MRHLLIASLSLALLSCENGNEHKSKEHHDHSDSIVSVTDSTYTRSIETDSGRIILTHHAYDELETATIYDKSGYAVYRGSMLNGERTGAWMQYNREGKIISAWQYSKGKVLHQLDATDFETKPLHLHQMGIVVEVPTKWFVPESKNPWALVTVEKREKSDTSLFVPSINISKGEIETGETLDQLADEQLKLLHSSVGRVETIDTSYFNIDGNCGFKRYGMYSNPAGQTGFLDAIIVRGLNVYVISCTAPNTYQGEFLKYQEVFETAIESIHFED